MQIRADFNMRIFFTFTAFLFDTGEEHEVIYRNCSFGGEEIIPARFQRYIML